MMRDPHDSARWRNEISPLVRKYNPVCQWLNPENGKQCTHAAEVVHHLQDWKDAPLLFFEWSNLVAVCLAHHSGGQRGDTQHYAYADTIGPLQSIFRHGHCLPEWHKDYVAPTPVTVVKLIQGTTFSAVGDDALNRALAQD